MVQEIADGSNLFVEDADLPFATRLRVKRLGAADTNATAGVKAAAAKAKKGVR
jgi:hypothetical protein